MKYISRVLIICVLTMFLYGCGEKEKIGGYKYASYDELATSTSVEYSYEGRDIYIEGTLTGFEMMMFDEIEYLIANVKERDGKNWIVRIGQAGTCSDARLTDLIGTKIRCFGDFLKKEGSTPVLVLNTEGDNCIQKCKGDKTTYTAEDLKPTSVYVLKWYGDNTEEVIIADVYDVLAKIKKPGAYMSSGIIQGIDGREYFSLYQKDGDKFESTLIYFEEDPLSVSSLQDIKKDMKDGDAIKIYFVVDEKGRMHVIDYHSTTVNYTYNPEELKAETVFEKKYAWGDDCSIRYKVMYNYDKTYHYDIEAVAKDYDSANAACFWYLLVFAENDAGFTLTVKLKDSKEGFMMIRSGSLENALWWDKTGEVIIKSPNWFNVSETTDPIAIAMIDVIDIDNLFEEDYGYDFK